MAAGRLRLMAIAVAVVIIVGLSLVLWRTTTSPEVPEALPDGSLIVAEKGGAEALGVFERLSPGLGGLLGSSVREPVLAAYENGAWLFLAKSGRGCGGLLESIAEYLKENQESSLLTQALKRQSGGGAYYLAIGKLDSSVHVFWCHGGSLVWLRVPATLPSDVVEGLLSSMEPD